jgi:hypothetical protein
MQPIQPPQPQRVIPSLQALVLRKTLSSTEGAFEKLSEQLTPEFVESIIMKKCAELPLDALKKLPDEIKRNLPLVADVPLEYLNFAVSAKLEFLSQFTSEYNHETSFAESNIRELTKERGQCFVDVIKFLQSETCPFSEDAKTAFKNVLIEDFGDKRSLFFIDLRGQDLSNLDLSHLYLQFTNCAGTNFANCQVNHTHFTNGNFVNAQFSGAQGKWTCFADADLTGADFTDAILNEAIFRWY